MFRKVTWDMCQRYSKLEGIMVYEVIDTKHHKAVRMLVTYPSAKQTYASTKVVGARWCSVEFGAYVNESKKDLEARIIRAWSFAADEILKTKILF